MMNSVAREGGGGHANAITLLVIDDSAADRRLYKLWLEKDAARKYRIIEAENAVDGLEAFSNEEPDIILLDFNMHGIHGLEFFWQLKQSGYKLPPVILITGMHHPEVQKEALHRGLTAYLDKNALTAESLIEVVSLAIGVAA